MVVILDSPTESIGTNLLWSHIRTGIECYSRIFGPTYSDAHEIALRQARVALQRAVVKRAQEALDLQRQDMVARWTAKARDNGIIPGQTVYVKRDPKSKSRKLRLQFEGPYRVLGINEYNNVRLRYIGNQTGRGRKPDEIEAPLSYVKPIRVGARGHKPTGYHMTTATQMVFSLDLPEVVPEWMQSMVELDSQPSHMANPAPVNSVSIHAVTSETNGYLTIDQ